METDATGRTWGDWRALLERERLPCMVVDLDALDANVDAMLAVTRAAGLTLRPATKSLRVPAVMRHVAARGGDAVRGLMTYSAAETAWLHALGFDDLLLAYPVAREPEARLLAEVVGRGATVRVVVDDRAQLSVLAEAARRAGVVIDVCPDIDLSWRPLGSRLHIGVRRSPLRSAADVRALLAGVATDGSGGLRVAGVMAYEAQVAGLPDDTGRRLADATRRLMKRRSMQLAAARRAEVVAALRAMGHTLALVNGGGTGSLSETSRDPTCTEVTAGSGFFCPALFDGVGALALRPAAFFALPVVRRPDPDWVTCLAGGYLASGTPGADRAPRIFAPAGLTPSRFEGFGEVQTPLQVGQQAPPLSVGDPVILRHAKSGELAERFAEALLVRGGRVVERVMTYRGYGVAFG